MSTVALARLFDPDTSIDAGESVRPHLDAMKAEVLATAARWPGGATAYEVMVDLNREGRGRQQNSIVKRFSELEAAGFVTRTDRRRAGGSGRSLIVWELTAEGREAVR